MAPAGARHSANSQNEGRKPELTAGRATRKPPLPVSSCGYGGPTPCARRACRPGSGCTLRDCRGKKNKFRVLASRGGCPYRWESNEDKLRNPSDGRQPRREISSEFAGRDRPRRKRCARRAYFVYLPGPQEARTFPARSRTLRAYAEYNCNRTHEAFVRLAGSSGSYTDRAHFLRAAATVMRHLLVDYARKRNASKRGAGVAPLTLQEDRFEKEDDTLAVLALDDAIKGIARVDPQLEQIIECRFFAGLTVQETADALGMSVRSVERGWQKARAYLATTMETPD